MTALLKSVPIKGALTALAALMLAGAASAEQTDLSTLSAYNCQKTPVHEGQTINLTDARLTFSDDFDTPSIVRDGGRGKWYTGVHGGFGGAKFLDYQKGDDTFKVKKGQLTIRMQNRGGKWVSGLIQSVDSKGHGFAQTYGYFEMRAKLPRGAANWPAFWLKTVNQFTDPTETRTEIDVFEGYGGNDPDGYHFSIHLWPAAKQPDPPNLVTKHWGKSCYRKIPGGLFDDQFHQFGVRTTPDWVIVYFDRQEIMRFQSLPEFHKPLFVLANLAYSGAEKRDDIGPSDMAIDYIKVWSLPDDPGE
jgi:beta-glucanase (GH16 family)